MDVVRGAAATRGDVTCGGGSVCVVRGAAATRDDGYNGGGGVDDVKTKGQTSHKNLASSITSKFPQYQKVSEIKDKLK